MTSHIFRRSRHERRHTLSANQHHAEYVESKWGDGNCTLVVLKVSPEAHAELTPHLPVTISQTNN